MATYLRSISVFTTPPLEYDGAGRAEDWKERGPTPHIPELSQLPVVVKNDLLLE